MESFIFDDIPFTIDRPALLEVCGVNGKKHLEPDLAGLVEEASALARPKALFKAVTVETAEDDRVFIEGLTLTSHVLKVKLAKVSAAFPLAATCGVEIDDWARSIKDTLRRYWAEVVKGAALKSAVDFLVSHITRNYHLDKTAIMSPGSLPDWPIEEQRPLFAILGDAAGTIGVRLTASYAMTPSHTISGILFPTEISFSSCQLCLRENCSGRKAPYTGRIE